MVCDPTFSRGFRMRDASGLASSSNSSRVILPDTSRSLARLSTVMVASALALSTFFSCGTRMSQPGSESGLQHHHHLMESFETCKAT